MLPAAIALGTWLTYHWRLTGRLDRRTRCASGTAPPHTGLLDCVSDLGDRALVLSYGSGRASPRGSPSSSR